jgi:hypothetical protein
MDILPAQTIISLSLGPSADFGGKNCKLPNRLEYGGDGVYTFLGYLSVLNIGGDPIHLQWLGIHFRSLYRIHVFASIFPDGGVLHRKGFRTVAQELNSLLLIVT